MTDKPFFFANFANANENLMKGTRIAGFIFLGLLWVWLSQYLLRASGFNLKNLLIVAMTGVIILVPLYKKYINPNK